MHDNERVIKEYSDMVFRIVRLRLPDSQAADDAYQNTFLHWMQHAPDFKDTAHEKAWFIRCALNCAADVLRDKSRHRTAAIEDCLGDDEPYSEMPEYSGIFDALRRLPEKYSAPLYLHYVEGYDTNELAKILRITGSGARMRLKRGRELLYEVYMGRKSDKNERSEDSNEKIQPKQFSREPV